MRKRRSSAQHCTPKLKTILKRGTERGPYAPRVEPVGCVFAPLGRGLKLRRADAHGHVQSHRVLSRPLCLFKQAEHQLVYLATGGGNRHVGWKGFREVEGCLHRKVQ